MRLRLAPLSLCAAVTLASLAVPASPIFTIRRYDSRALAPNMVATAMTSLVPSALPRTATSSGRAALPPEKAPFVDMSQRREGEPLVVTGLITRKELDLNSVSVGSLQSDTSSNWSGYTLTDGRYTGVYGTFTVPSARYLAGSSVCEWVGIDGWDDSSLVQAGVDEIPTAGGVVIFQPWWEVVPAPQTPVFTVEIHAGDIVRVTIGQVTGREWAITLVDITDREGFETEQSYNGPASSAEWVVEADTPGNGSTNDPATLAPYVPDVSFSDLGVGLGQSGPPVVSRVVMLQKGSAVSVPSPLQRGEFSVAYARANPEEAQRSASPSTGVPATASWDIKDSP
jgi:Peptidase A4 family